MLILDYQMPIKNGLDVVNEVKEYYNSLVIEHDQELTRDLFLIEPAYVFLSAFVGSTTF